MGHLLDIWVYYTKQKKKCRGKISPGGQGPPELSAGNAAKISSK